MARRPRRRTAAAYGRARRAAPGFAAPWLLTHARRRAGGTASILRPPESQHCVAATTRGPRRGPSPPAWCGDCFSCVWRGDCLSSGVSREEESDDREKLAAARADLLFVAWRSQRGKRPRSGDALGALTERTDALGFGSVSRPTRRGCPVGPERAKPKSKPGPAHAEWLRSRCQNTARLRSCLQGGASFRDLARCYGCQGLPFVSPYRAQASGGHPPRRRRPGAGEEGDLSRGLHRRHG